MKPVNKRKWVAIIIFYAIAVIVRALALQLDVPTVINVRYFGIAWAEGIGPCLGAIAAVVLFKRRFFCSITGSSIIKSVLCAAIPFTICFFLYRELSYVLLGFLFYSFLEEVGWRGYLQGELEDKNPFIQALMIGVMWFLWHLQIGFNLDSLIFLAILIFGAWGIGRIAKDTHSLIACACFHTLFNFSNHGFFPFTPAVICMYVGVIASWFIIWYVPWGQLLQKQDKQN